MAVALEVDNLDNVPEHLKSEYTERDGKYYFNIEGDLPDPGWKDKVHELNKESAKHRKQAEELAAKLASVNLDEYKTLKEKADKAEEEKMILEGKHKELADRQLEIRDKEWARQIAAKEQELEEERKRVDSYKARALDDQIRAAINGKVHDKAVKGALLEARTMFVLDEKGNAVMLDEEGNIKIGKDGKTAFSPSEWISSEETKDENPHWYAASLGGTGAIQTNGSGGGKTMARAHFMTLSPPAQSKIMREGVVRVVDK